MPAQTEDLDAADREYYDVYIISEDGYEYRSSSNFSNPRSNLNYGKSGAVFDSNGVRRKVKSMKIKITYCDQPEGEEEASVPELNIQNFFGALNLDKPLKSFENDLKTFKSPEKH